jgi:uncharacterized protein YfaS (alpha-2-macroglobulin family)
MNIDTNKVAGQLSVTLQDAVESGRIQVRVTDNREPPRPIAGAQVDARDVDGMILVRGTTDANGEVTLEIDFSGLDVFATKAIMVIATQEGMMQSEKTVAAIALGTIDVDLVLIP